ncbi:MAG TPA: hypothetical protein VFS93_06130 [Terrimesophilobacter sp.]|nr:hypothetical protein [Terrimesophilobacter sp.]
MLNVALLGGVVAIIVAAGVMRDLSWLDLMLWLLFAGVALLLVNVFASSGMRPRRPEGLALAAAEKEGRLAVARLLRIRQTGTFVNLQPLCELTIAVAPTDRAAYRTSLRQVIQMIDVANWQPGMPLVVIRHSLDRPEITVLQNPPAGWLAQAAAAPEIDPPTWSSPPGIRTVLFGKVPGWIYPIGFLVGAGLALLPILLG